MNLKNTYQRPSYISEDTLEAEFFRIYSLNPIITFRETGLDSPERVFQGIDSYPYRLSFEEIIKYNKDLFIGYKEKAKETEGRIKNVMSSFGEDSREVLYARKDLLDIVLELMSSIEDKCHNKN